MTNEFTESQIAIRNTFKKFTDEKLKPMAARIDEKDEFPSEAFRAIAELGFFGMRYPEEDGGSALDFLSYCLALEELARGSLPVAALSMMQSLQATHFLHRFGSSELKERIFRPALRGELKGTICITEPNAGSDLSAISTRARKSNDCFILNGQKTWITGAPDADFFIVFARFPETKHSDVHEQEEKSKGLSATPLSIFLVERKSPGLIVGRKIDKLGVRSCVTSEVSFDDCVVPSGNLLGESGKGEQYLREILSLIRVATGALALGVGRAALEDAVVYSKQRVQFGKPIGKFQAIQMRLADMTTDLEAARCLVYHAARLVDKDERVHQKEAAMAKLFASEAAARVCDGAARVLASYGYAMEYPVQRYLRDVRFTLIGGGTSEILKLIIAREL